MNRVGDAGMLACVGGLPFAVSASFLPLPPAARTGLRLPTLAGGGVMVASGVFWGAWCGAVQYQHEVLRFLERRE